jgi:hypothetical protein
MPFLQSTDEWESYDGATTDGTQSMISRLTVLNYNSSLREKLIEDFYKNVDKKYGDWDIKNIMRELIIAAEDENIELTDSQKANLVNLACMPKPRQRVVDILTKFSTLGSVAPIEEQIIVLASCEIGDMSPESPTHSVRNNRYQNMKTVLSAFRDVGSISEKQYYIFMELYAHEDLPLLAAFEVLDYTNDSYDF